MCVDFLGLVVLMHQGNRDIKTVWSVSASDEKSMFFRFNSISYRISFKKSGSMTVK